jgi:predicted TIM-barrel fold metal-dependent hydrolase
MLPDMAVENYMAPMKKYAEMYGDVMDFRLDEQMPFDDYDVGIDEPIHMMDANHVDYSVVLATDFELVGDHRMTNEEYTDWLFKRCEADDRFIPFIGVDPNRGSAALDMIKTFVRKYEPRGIKIYPATGFYPDDPKLDPYWDLVDDLGLVVVTHAGMALPPLDERYCHPKNLERVADRHPDMKIIVAHLGGKFHDELFPLMAEHDNVFTDCSALQGWVAEDKGMIDRRLKEVIDQFPDRVVFGTDFPLYQSAFSMTQYLRLIHEGKWGNDTVKEKLLGGNMARILGL